MNNLMTKDDFYKKYAEVAFELSSYSKYVFIFEGVYEYSNVLIEVGGNPDAMYNCEFYIGDYNNIYNLEPYLGTCGYDTFYDY